MRFFPNYRRRRVYQCGCVLLTIATLAAEARSAHRLARPEVAGRLGLARAWFTQVRLDGARNHVERAVLLGDRLTVLTSAGVVQELNAVTGQTYWVAPVGNENYPSLGPSGNDKVVALVNGSTLYVLDRTDGKPLIIRRVGGAPGAAPAVAERYVFVPLVNGRIEAYPLAAKEQKLTPWYYQSFGKAMVAPLATPESIVWTTDAGFLYVGNSNELKMRFRLETGSDIVAPPAYHRPFVYAGSVAGELFAMNELTGDRQWKYSTGYTISRPAAVVGQRVFVTSDEPSLHCIDATIGAKLWEAPKMAQFAAMSKDRVYGMSDLGAFVVMNAETGARLGQVSGERSARALVNDQTDRIYVVSDDGMIECFHEIGAKEPMYHNPKPPEPEKKAAAPAAPTASTTPNAAEKSVRPQKAGAIPAEKPKRDENKPAKKGGAGPDENPFGS